MLCIVFWRSHRKYSLLPFEALVAALGLVSISRLGAVLDWVRACVKVRHGKRRITGHMGNGEKQHTSRVGTTSAAK
eukprot:scaffold11972_cov38-Prasinocladus_malaysianus.AAC.1